MMARGRSRDSTGDAGQKAGACTSLEQRRLSLMHAVRGGTSSYTQATAQALECAVRAAWARGVHTSTTEQAAVMQTRPQRVPLDAPIRSQTMWPVFLNSTAARMMSVEMVAAPAARVVVTAQRAATSEAPMIASADPGLNPAGQGRCYSAGHRAERCCSTDCLP